MSLATERRFFSPELRAASSGRRISGLAAPFGVRADIGLWVEEVQRGAFARSIEQRADVAALLNHDDSRVLGRISNGTLRLQEVSRGLQFSCDTSRTTAGDDALSLIRRRDVYQMSFGFSVPDGGESWDTTIDSAGRRRDLRTLTDIDLFDVSPVTFAAYGQTSVAADGVQKRDGECECTCEECQNGDCEDCSDEDCADENCRCQQRSARRRRAPIGLPIGLLFPAGAPAHAPVEMRSAIARALGAVSDPKVITRAVLSDAEWEARARARAALAMLEDLGL